MARPNPKACLQPMTGILETHGIPAVLLDDELRIVATNGAYRNRFNNGQAACGRFCYQVSHGHSSPCYECGERCPVAEVARRIRPCSVVHVHHTSAGAEHHEVTIYPVPVTDGAMHYIELFRTCSTSKSEDGERALIGSSAPIQQMRAAIRRVARSDVSVLILGETGSGKDLVAEMIHGLSQRQGHKQVPVDCAGLPESLIESELFGHEKGAFTDAFTRKDGLVRAADSGTLFLDEIGDISISTQAKMLRLLETGTYRRVGGTELLSTDFRLLCATSRDLPKMIQRGEFREDLYYRIAAFPIYVPPLRERLDDIEQLVHGLLRRISPDRDFEVSDEFLDALRRYPFPGNVRELKNILERSTLLVETSQLLAEHLPNGLLGISGCSSFPRNGAGVRPLDEVVSQYIGWAARVHSGDRRDLAQRLGLSERSLYRKLRELRDRGRKSPSGNQQSLFSKAQSS